MAVLEFVQSNVAPTVPVSEILTIAPAQMV
jgi:hypothetical protein